MSDLERWRQLFREEAQRCVKELREVIEQDGRGVMARHPIRHLMQLMQLMQHVSRFFKFLQVSSRSCPIFGVEDMDVFFILHHVTYIMLRHVACAVAVSEWSRKDGREQGHRQVAPGIPGERGDTRGIDPQLGFGSLVAFPSWIEPGQLDMH